MSWRILNCQNLCRFNQFLFFFSSLFSTVDSDHRKKISLSLRWLFNRIFIDFTCTTVYLIADYKFAPNKTENSLILNNRNYSLFFLYFQTTEFTFQVFYARWNNIAYLDRAKKKKMLLCMCCPFNRKKYGRLLQYNGVFQPKKRHKHIHFKCSPTILLHSNKYGLHLKKGY